MYGRVSPPPKLSSHASWNKWITFPIHYCDLPLSAQITFTVRDIAGPRAAVPVGGTTFRLFSKKWTLRRGKHRLLLWLGTEADGSIPGSTDEMGRLEKLVKKYERGDLAKSEWLDKLTFRKMKEIHAVSLNSENLYLYLDFPVIFKPCFDLCSFASCATASTTNTYPIHSPRIMPRIGVTSELASFLWVHVSLPHRRSSSITHPVNLSDLKRKISYGSSASILLEINALTQLKAVTWRDPSEVKQVVEELLPQWTEIVTDEALELLGPGTVDSRVRAFAVRQLMRANDEELLLQLVPALEFESARSYDDSGLTDFLISKGVQNSILAKRARVLRTSKDSSIKKEEHLQALLTDSKNNLSSMPPLPFPLNAQIEITGIIPKKSSVFKSAMYPLLLTFQCSDGTECPVIFKDRDDMRQDQLVLQENLALKLTPYAVLATGQMQGMAQFMPSKTIAAIVSEYGNVLSYLRAGYPDEGSVGTWGIEPGVIDTFVRSCAGYCVVTYLLGVGDRHLDNLLIAPDGHFFHVDFGYIFGRDPKPFPPAVKVCKEMVDGMGGTQSAQYMRFKSFCFAAFTILRKSANLILNLVTLMVDASIPDIKYRDVHEQIQEKCRLERRRRLSILRSDT
ncbi:kinase-like protein [Gymnopus androsaceus JB14]|uniref:phosphatidylinositol 3-kinase n=1 Tax=Gymnopus androsaceus JB14 TaxID=1447944 RepID=A0A6A4GHI4_9AGAR|nr:kinase-like protein [Gymnopus androsaceus JB14]